MRTLNLGIVAHVDAAKTSLTEQLLFAAGITDTIGSGDEGSTHTDYLALKRQRGITINSAVVSFIIDDVPVNLSSSQHRSQPAQSERVSAACDAMGLMTEPS